MPVAVCVVIVKVASKNHAPFRGGQAYDRKPTDGVDLDGFICDLVNNRCQIVGLDCRVRLLNVKNASVGLYERHGGAHDLCLRAK